STMSQKRTLLTLIISISCAAVFAQSPKCHTDEALQLYLNQSPNLRDQIIAQEQTVREWIRNNRQDHQRTSGSVVTIPTVFHIVYKNNTQNIADSNITRQIAILNECYRLQNTNFSQTRSIFDTIAADVEVDFCLASIDPSGNPTTGITRTQAPAGSFFDPILGFDNVKRSANGGKDPWPADQYLNIWICDMSLFGLTAVLGYAQFPGGNPLTDGVVIQYQFTGFMPNNTSSDLGKTAVHEVGHWLGLRHIWGDGQGSSTPCDSTDYVDDTPNADTASQQTCIIKNSCNNESAFWSSIGVDPPDMMENYMDYSYDACMTMFTQGQKDRMLGFLNTLRASLLNSPGCGSTSLPEPNVNNPVVYPNPAHHSIGIGGVSTKPKSIQIMDLSGKTYFASAVQEFGEIEINQLSAGTYLVQVEFENGTSRAIRFVKQ
ncbi:MAG: M43 family zinc metalloprotease, partial [Bacteroidota bacterium]